MRRTLSLLLCFVLLFGTFNFSIATPIQAEDLKYDDFLYHTNIHGEITITGYTGINSEVKIPAEINGMPVKSITVGTYPSQMTSIWIPYSVTMINTSVFDLSNNLTTIEVDNNNPKYSSLNGVLFDKDKTIIIKCPNSKNGAYSIPDTVKIIEDYAFLRCYGITSINIPNGLEIIYDASFFGCTGLTSIIIPSSILFIENDSFEYCKGLKGFDVDSNNSNYCSENGVLYNKEKTYLLNYPNAKAGEYTIPSSVTSINPYAFVACTGLTSLTLPKDYKEDFDYRLINDCTALTDINADSTNPVYSSYDGILLNKDQSTLLLCPPGRENTISIPKPVANINKYAFFLCENLTSIHIPSTVTNIGRFAFSNCNKLKTITLSNSKIKIGFYAFSYCRNLTTVVIPNNVIDIDPSAFEGCCQSKLTLYVRPDSYALTFAKQSGYKYIIETDIDQVLWATDSIQDVIVRDIMSGNINEDSNLTFNPTANATRAEFADALFNYLGLTKDRNKTFTDTTNHWAKDKISKLADLGLMQGVSETAFAPDDPITREQIATILNRAIKPIASSTDFKYQDDAFISDWAKDSVYASYSAGWIKGDDLNNFNPSAPATRAELAVIFSRLANANIESTQE